MLSFTKLLSFQVYFPVVILDLPLAFIVQTNSMQQSPWKANSHSMYLELIYSLCAEYCMSMNNQPVRISVHCVNSDFVHSLALVWFIIL
jgi:hypothetical protein